MIDVRHQISAVERQVGRRTLAAGAGPGGDDQPELPRPGRGRMGRLHQPRAAAPLVPAGHRRAPGGRSLPAEGQRRAAPSSAATRRTPSPLPGSTAARSAGSRCRITAEGERARLQLEHIAHVDDERWAEFGPGAVGVGWDLGFRGLAEHLATGADAEPEPSSGPPPRTGVRFMTESSEAWSAPRSPPVTTRPPRGPPPTAPRPLTRPPGNPGRATRRPRTPRPSSSTRQPFGSPRNRPAGCAVTARAAGQPATPQRAAGGRRAGARSSRPRTGRRRACTPPRGTSPRPRGAKSCSLLGDQLHHHVGEPRVRARRWPRGRSPCPARRPARAPRCPGPTPPRRGRTRTRPATTTTAGTPCRVQGVEVVADVRLQPRHLRRAGARLPHHVVARPTPSSRRDQPRRLARPAASSGARPRPAGPRRRPRPPGRSAR